MTAPLTQLTLIYALDPKTNELGLTVLPDGPHIPAGEIRKAEKELSGSYSRLSAASHPAEFAFTGTFPHLPTGPYRVTRQTHGPGHREPTIRLEYQPPATTPAYGSATSSAWEQTLLAGAARLLAASSGPDPGLAAGVSELARLLDGDRELIVWICLIGYLTAAERETRARAGQFESLLSLAIEALGCRSVDPFVPVPSPSGNAGRTWWQWLGLR